MGARLRQKGSRWGGFILTLDRAGSTNDVARELARRGAPHGSLFIAKEQSGGRGRFRRPWISLPGGLYLSVLLRPESSAHVSLLPHLASVAAAEALIAASSLDIELRWPNDLYSGGRKLGGILCEGSFKGAEPEVFVVGIGINVHVRAEQFPPEVEVRATDLSELGLDGDDVTADIVARLESWWRAGEPDRIVARFRELAEGARGRRLLVQPRDGETYEAVSRGIADDGGLVIEIDDGGERILYSEDVIQLRDSDERSR